MNQKLLTVVIVLSVIVVVAIIFTSQGASNIRCGEMNTQYCETDEDCVCKEDGCFVGGKTYWEKCVDKSNICTGRCPQDCSCVSNFCNCAKIGHA